MIYNGKGYKQIYLFFAKGTNIFVIRALTTFKLEGEVTSFSEGSHGEMDDKREVGRLLREVNGDYSKHCFANPLKLPCPNLVNSLTCLTGHLK
jgi:hypothetical protein